MSRTLALVTFAFATSACWSQAEPAKPAPAVASVQEQPTEEVPEVRDIVQPVKLEKVDDDEGVEGGVEGGEVGGVVGGVVGGMVGGPPPPPPPPPPAPPQNIPPTLLEANRISGDKLIVPDQQTKDEIAAAGRDKILGSWKLCIDDTGAISTVSQLKSTGFGAYDTKIQTALRTWRYTPYLVNGKAVPVCTAVTFIYSQK